MNSVNILRKIRQIQSAGRWWLTLVILATQEAAIRRTEARSQLGEIVHKTLSQKYPRAKSLRVAQVVEPCKNEALSSNPSIIHK
jgi:dephospho-CoA kinase